MKIKHIAAAAAIAAGGFAAAGGVASAHHLNLSSAARCAAERWTPRFFIQQPDASWGTFKGTYTIAGATLPANFPPGTSEVHQAQPFTVASVTFSINGYFEKNGTPGQQDGEPSWSGSITRNRPANCPPVTTTTTTVPPTTTTTTTLAPTTTSTVPATTAPPTTVPGSTASTTTSPGTTAPTTPPPVTTSPSTPPTVAPTTEPTTPPVVTSPGPTVTPAPTAPAPSAPAAPEMVWELPATR